MDCGEIHHTEADVSSCVYESAGVIFTGGSPHSRLLTFGRFDIMAYHSVA